MKPILLILTLFLTSFSLQAQTDFPALKQQLFDYLRVDNQDSALYIARKMNQLALKEQSDTSYWYALSMYYQGIPHYIWGNTDSTISYWKSSVNLFEKRYPNSAAYASSLNDLGNLSWEMGDYKATEPLYLQALEIRKKALGEEHSDVASSLNNLGLLYETMGDYKAAEPLYKQSLEIYKKTLGEEHPDYESALNSLATLYWKMGDYKLAEPYYKQALDIYKKTLGEEHPDYANGLFNLGTLYSDMGDYKAAESYSKQALEIYRKSLGEEHPDYASALNSLGTLYWKMVDYKLAEPYYKQALDIYKKTLGEEHPDYANGLFNLGTLYSDMGDYKAAEPYSKQALEIYRKSLGEEHPDYASSLNDLGVLYSYMGDYQTAEIYFKQELKIYKKVYGEEHSDVASSLGNLGNLYSDLGDYESAEPLFMQALDIKKKTLGEEHPDVASSLINLGNLYSDLGNYKAAEPLYKIALEIYRKALGEEHPNYAISLNSHGILYSDMGDYKAAELYLKQALEIKKKTLGEEHPDYAYGLNSLGTLYSDMGDYKAAEPFYKQTLEIYKKTLGEEHPDYSMSLNNLGNLYSVIGDYNSAKQYLISSNSVKINNLSKNFSWLSAKEKEAYWVQENEFYSNLNSFVSKASIEVPSSTELSYNGNLVSKSLLLETSRELDQAMAASSDTTLKENYQNLKLLRKNYSKLVSEGSDNKELMECLNREADSLDKILVNSLGEYAASKRKFEITWKDVQSNLNSTEAAIEFTKYYDDKDSVYKYMALVIRPDYEYPKIALLGEDELISEYIENRSFEALYPLVWEPIEKHLSGVERVYYSPSGQLNNLSFNALCMGERKELSQTDSSKTRNIITLGSKSDYECTYLMDRYEVHQLTTTRYIADGTLEKETSMNTSIALCGGINYDAIPASNSNDKEEDNDEYFLAQNLSKRNEDRSSSNISMGYLQGTKEEVEQIGKLVASKSWKESTYTETDAEEGKVKEALETQQTGIIHIATHGFAFPDVKKNKRQQQLMETEEISYRASEDPMVRCGLMFSGSNVSWTGDPQKMIEETGEDGILTAAEVSNMDLSNTKLVVLSACETGLGKIEGSEGTFGLKRGFKLAGVEQMIVSLWSVPDKETMELMTIFYEDLTDSLNPVKSFEKAQKQMRETYPKRPDKWAGFVLVR